MKALLSRGYDIPTMYVLARIFSTPTNMTCQKWDGVYLPRHEKSVGACGWDQCTFFFKFGSWEGVSAPKSIVSFNFPAPPFSVIENGVISSRVLTIMINAGYDATKLENCSI